MKNKSKALLLTALLLVAALAFYGLYRINAPQGAEGLKTIEVKISGHGADRSLTIETGEPFLRGALEQEGLIAGTESAYGLFVITVDGVAADPALQQWWRFTINGGQELTTGVDTTPVEDGATYEIALATGW